MKTGLGRGLDSLFSVYEKEEELTKVAKSDSSNVDSKSIAPKEGVLEIDITQVDANKNQPRKNFNEEAMKELSDSIKVHGVIQPIIVVKRNGRYMVIAGERRFRATKMAGLSTIPAIIKDYTDKEIREVSIIENLQREDLNPIETARAIKELMDEFAWTQEVVASRLGKSRPAIANTIRLLQLQPEVIKLIEEGKLSAGHARSLVVVTDKEAQLKLAKMACARQITVRDLEKVVKKQTGAGHKSTTKEEQSIELKQLVTDMQRVFSTKVNILGSDKRGRIYIDYYNSDDLDRIHDLVEYLKNK
ncbi:MAG: ParB/RepB/Spo0J family partition protein [Spirochaetales bacterium]